ncbi:MAG: hypothetical protein WD045_01415 [Pirellulaceae bacterium]
MRHGLMAIAQLATVGCLLAIATTAKGANVEAYAGQPWGVGKITVSFQRADFGDPLDSHAFGIEDTEGRIFYPAFEKRRILPLLQSLMGADRVTPPQELTTYFLFIGDQPLDVVVRTPTPQTIRVVPEIPRRPARYQSSLNQWWRQYHENSRGQREQGDYSPVVETYLSAMLSQRMGMELPLRSREEMADRSALEPNQSLMLMLGAEKVHDALLKSLMFNELSNEGPRVPLPPPIRWQELPIPDAVTDVAIEPLAMQAPQECFYVRFGGLGNYLWLNRLLERNGGDLSKMVSNRGVSMHINEVVQRQLALKQSALAEVFGDAVVADMAIIGRDTYTKEGASIGMLFQARNSGLLNNDIRTNYRNSLRQFEAQGATLETVEIAGHEVQFLSTPDNTLRSFHVQRGDFHLVTTSRDIVTKFLNIKDGAGSLGETREFRYARGLMPLDRDDTVFAYLSSEFFRALHAPQYQVELRRRLRSVVEMELLQIARAAAANEYLEDLSVESLQQTGFLPMQFGDRADGSEIFERDGKMHDSLRGGRGNFLPIADVPIETISPLEARSFEGLRRFHLEQWRQMDPIMVGIHRFKLNDEGLERLAIDARMSPFQRENYQQFISRLGPPLHNHIAPTSRDMATFQAVLRGDAPGAVHHYAVGVQDLAFPIQDFSQGGLLNTLRMIQATPGYLTAWPKPGIIDRIPLIGAAAAPDPFGYSQLPFGLWRREWNDFSTMSFHFDILREVTEQLHLVEDEHPAQVRLHVGDVSNAQVTPLANQLAQAWARSGSHGNARFFHMLNQQLGVPMAEAKEFGDNLLNAELICPLDGEFQVVRDIGGYERWVSTGWGNENTEFQARLMGWFRGLNARLNVEESRLVLHAELDMQGDKPEPRLRLPSFNLFGGFGGAADSDKEEVPAEAIPEAEPLPSPPPEPSPPPQTESGRQF